MTTRVKVFRFEVSNPASSPCKEDLQKEHFQKLLQQLISEDTIEDTINDFIQDKSNVSILVNTVQVHTHNNARGNTVDLIYTISYTEYE